MTEEVERSRSDLFQRERGRFSNAVSMAIAVSKSAGDRMSTKPIVMASYVFTRMCIAADSLLHQLQRDLDESMDRTLDHYSIGVIARNIIEAALMFHYLSEDGVSDEQWALRGAILDLHDVTVKVRLFKSIGATDQYQKFKGYMTGLRERIKANGAFALVDSERQEKLLSGQELYVNGFRSTLKLVESNDKYFDGMYAYLSSQVHVAPSSFYFTDHRLGFREPSGYQYYFAAYSIAHARMFLLCAAVRLADSDAVVRKKVDDTLYESMDALRKIPFGD